MYGVESKGWVADDIHSESASRTLDYACKSTFFPASCVSLNSAIDDDCAAYKLGVA